MKIAQKMLFIAIGFTLGLIYNLIANKLSKKKGAVIIGDLQKTKEDFKTPGYL